MHAIAELLPADALVVDEAVSSARAARFLHCDGPELFRLRGGGIGWGLPAAIGVKLALPDRPVVALIGDGSAMYTIQGLWTAARERCPMVFVILDNPLSHPEAAAERDAGARGAGRPLCRHGPGRPAVDFVAVARGLGLTAHRATTIAEVKELLAVA